MAVRSIAPRPLGRAWILALSLFLTGFTVAIVAALSTGSLNLVEAVFLLFAPVVALGIALRPAWVVVFILAVPIGLLKSVPTRGFVLLALLTVGAQLLTHGKLYAGWRSGMLPMLLLIALAYVYGAEGADQNQIARGYFNLLVFWTLLGLIAYNSVRLRELEARTVVAALVFGAAIETFLEVTGLAGSELVTAGGEARSGIRLGYVGAMGFSVSFGSLLLADRYVEAGKRILLAALTVFFLAATVLAFVRASWVAALLFVVFIARWARKRKYWLVLPLTLLVILMVPIARERVLPGSSSGLREVSAADVTTGRTELWGILWEEEVVPALPWGNGYGHTFTLTPQQLFGAQRFQPESTPYPFVFPHNDFIYWMVEFGLIGLVVWLVFWKHLLAVFRRVTAGPDESARRSCYVLAGVLIMMLIVQLVDNAFAIQSVSSRFFVVAGVIFGLNATVRSPS